MPSIHFQPHHRAYKACRLDVIIRVTFFTFFVTTPSWIICKVQFCYILKDKKQQDLSCFTNDFSAMTRFPGFFLLHVIVLAIFIGSEMTSQLRSCRTLNFVALLSVKPFTLRLLICDAASIGVLSADLSNRNSMTASLLYNL